MRTGVPRHTVIPPHAPPQQLHTAAQSAAHLIRQSASPALLPRTHHPHTLVPHTGAQRHILTARFQPWKLRGSGMGTSMRARERELAPFPPELRNSLVALLIDTRGSAVGAAEAIIDDMRGTLGQCGWQRGATDEERAVALFHAIDIVTDVGLWSPGVAVDIASAQLADFLDFCEPHISHITDVPLQKHLRREFLRAYAEGKDYRLATDQLPTWSKQYARRPKAAPLTFRPYRPLDYATWHSDIRTRFNHVYIRRALQITDGDVHRACALAGVAQYGLNYHLRHLGIDPDQWWDATPGDSLPPIAEARAQYMATAESAYWQRLFTAAHGSASRAAQLATITIDTAQQHFLQDILEQESLDIPTPLLRDTRRMGHMKALYYDLVGIIQHHDLVAMPQVENWIMQLYRATRREVGSSCDATLIIAVFAHLIDRAGVTKNVPLLLQAEGRVRYFQEHALRFATIGLPARAITAFQRRLQQAFIAHQGTAAFEEQETLLMEEARSAAAQHTLDTLRRRIGQFITMKRLKSTASEELVTELLQPTERRIEGIPLQEIEQHLIVYHALAQCNSRSLARNLAAIEQLNRKYAQTVRDMHNTIKEPMQRQAARTRMVEVFAATGDMGQVQASIT